MIGSNNLVSHIWLRFIYRPKSDTSSTHPNFNILGLIHIPISPSYLIFRAILSTAAFDWAQTNIFIFFRFFKFLSYYKAIRLIIDSVFPVPGGPCIRKIPAERWKVFFIAATCDAFLLWTIWVYTFELTMLRYLFLSWISS